MEISVSEGHISSAGNCIVVELICLKWEKPSEELMEFLTAKLENVKCEKRKMFGQFAFFLNGNMFTGVFQSKIFLRLSPESKKETMEHHPKISQFEPRKGQIMKEYITFIPEIVEDGDFFTQLLDSSIKYTSSLSPKKEK
jgi:TfoX/Sxy family transcriptional regulator of competence genes